MDVYDTDYTPLSKVHREDIAKGDLSFLGAELRDYEVWRKEYHQAKRRRFEPMFPTFELEPAFYFAPTEEEIAELGLRPMPDAPGYDYLICHQGKWREDRDRTNPVEPAFLNKHVCEKFFPFKRLGQMSLSACEETRAHLSDEARFRSASWVSRLSLLVSVLALIASCVALYPEIEKKWPWVTEFLSSGTVEAMD